MYIYIYTYIPIAGFAFVCRDMQVAWLGDRVQGWGFRLMVGSPEFRLSRVELSES